MKNILKKITVYFFSTGTAQILMLIFGMILVRKISMQEYAVYKQGSILITTFFAFICIYSPATTSFFISKSSDESERKNNIRISLIVINILAFSGFIILFILKPVIINLYDTGLMKYYNIFAFIMFFENGVCYYANYAVASNKNKKLAVITILYSLFRFLGLIISLLFKENLFSIFMLSYLIITIVKYIYLTYDVIKELDSKLKAANFFKIIKQHICFAIPLYATTLTATLNIYLDKNFVSFLYSPEQFSIYVNGSYDLPFVSLITSSIIPVMLPEISLLLKNNDQNSKNDIIQKYKKLLAITLILIIPFAMNIIAYSKGIVLILFSETYISSVQLFRLYSFSIIIKSMNITVLLTAFSKQKYVLFSGIAMILTNIMMLIIIKYTLGFDFLTLAPLTASAVMLFLNLLYVRKIYHQKSFITLIPVKIMFTSISVSILITVIIKLILSNFTFNIYGHTIIGCICSYLISIMLIILINRGKLKYDSI